MCTLHGLEHQAPTWLIPFTVAVALPFTGYGLIIAGLAIGARAYYAIAKAAGLDPSLWLTPLTAHIRLLDQRIETIESQAAGDRRWYREDVKKVRDRLGNDVTQLAQEIQQVASEAEALVADTLLQQLLGLVLVGMGTALTVVAALA